MRHVGSPRPSRACQRVVHPDAVGVNDFRLETIQMMPEVRRVSQRHRAANRVGNRTQWRPVFQILLCKRITRPEHRASQIVVEQQLLR